MSQNVNENTRTMTRTRVEEDLLLLHPKRSDKLVLQNASLCRGLHLEVAEEDCKLFSDIPAL